MIAVAPPLVTEANCAFKPLIEIVPTELNPLPDKAKEPPLYELLIVAKVGAEITTENSDAQLAQPRLL